MELFEEIRRSTSSELERSRVCPETGGASADGEAGPGRRGAPGEEEPGAEEAAAGAGDGIYQRGVGGGPEGPAETAAHASPDLLTDSDRVS